MANKAVTFLSKAGSIILQGIQIFMGISPLIGKQYPGTIGTMSVISKDLTQIGDAIVQAEAFGQALGLAGTQKLQAAIGPVTQIIMDSSLVAGKKVADPVLFASSMKSLASSIADLLNSLHPDSVVTSTPQAGLPAPNLTPTPVPPAS